MESIKRYDPMPYGEYQAIKRIASRLKVSEVTVRHWIKPSMLRTIDIGKGWRIAASDLEGFLMGHQTTQCEQYPARAHRINEKEN